MWQGEHTDFLRHLGREAWSGGQGYQGSGMGELEQKWESYTRDIMDSWLERPVKVRYYRHSHRP